MSAAGFKGTIINITQMEVVGRGAAGPVVRYTALFADEEGTVHATVKHEVNVAGNDKFADPTKLLLAACKEHCEVSHFAITEHEQEKPLHDGIHEEMGRPSDDDRDPGTQG